MILLTPTILLLPAPTIVNPPTVAVLLTYKAPPIPTPPATVNAPVFVLVLIVVAGILTTPAELMLKVAVLAGPPL